MATSWVVLCAMSCSAARPVIGIGLWLGQHPKHLLIADLSLLGPIFPFFCTPSPKKSLPWRAPNARLVVATKGLLFRLDPMSRLRMT